MLALKVFVLTFFVSSINAFSIGGLVSSAIDFIPVVGNVKSAVEAFSGKDIVTGEELSNTERTFSLLGAIPGVNYLKNGKHLKNGQKFLKAAQRAQNVGKLKNAAKFAQAGARAMAKADKVPKFIRTGFKAIKTVLKQCDGTEQE